MTFHPFHLVWRHQSALAVDHHHLRSLDPAAPARARHDHSVFSRPPIWLRLAAPRDRVGLQLGEHRRL
jgi:hypothetical protein